jgi:hypothetical protein
MDLKKGDTTFESLALWVPSSKVTRSAQSHEITIELLSGKDASCLAVGTLNLRCLADAVDESYECPLRLQLLDNPAECGLQLKFSVKFTGKICPWHASWGC